MNRVAKEMRRILRAIRNGFIAVANFLARRRRSGRGADIENFQILDSYDVVSAYFGDRARAAVETRRNAAWIEKEKKLMVDPTLAPKDSVTVIEIPDEVEAVDAENEDMLKELKLMFMSRKYIKEVVPPELAQAQDSQDNVEVAHASSQDSEDNVEAPQVSVQDCQVAEETAEETAEIDNDLPDTN